MQKNLKSAHAGQTYARKFIWTLASRTYRVCSYIIIVRCRTSWGEPEREVYTYICDRIWEKGPKLAVTTFPLRIKITRNRARPRISSKRGVWSAHTSGIGVRSLSFSPCLLLELYGSMSLPCSRQIKPGSRIYIRRKNYGINMRFGIRRAH